jgi:tetratricopeptide (TPR) repeat protein
MNHSMGKSRSIITNQSAFSDKNAIQLCLQQAINLQQNGNLVAAGRKYRSILKKLPNHSETLQRLAILLQQTGNSSSALHYMQKALNSDPKNPELLKNMAEIYRIQGDFENALRYAESSLFQQGDNVDALVIIAAACFEQNHLQKAIEVYTSALEINPHDVFVRNELANVHCAIGDNQKAAEQYKRALSQSPDFDDCRINLADTLVALEFYDEAVDHYQQVIKRQPKNAVIQNRLGSAFEKQGKIDNATRCYESALALNPKLIEARLNMGKCVLATDPNAAENWFSSVLTIDSSHAEGHYWLGIHAQTMGNFDRATSYFLTATDLNPEFADAWHRLSMNRDFEPSVEQLELLERRFNDTINSSPDDNNLITLGFTLGRFQEQREDIVSAFEYFHYANRLKSKLHRFDRAAHDAQIEDIINNFDSGFYEQRKEWGSASGLPVFIVGMPRSGTTLVEQILSAHPSIHGAGELQFMLDLVESLKNTVATRPKSHASRFIDLSQTEITDLAQEYLGDLQALQPQAVRILDKLPGNYLRLGIIFLLFPNAKIIHCKRDPMDTCWSCYQQNFEQGLHFTNDLEDMGHAYRGYLKLMAHWQTMFSHRILDVQYEDLLEDPNRHSRRLLQHCGLKWHPDVSNYAAKPRPVATASLWQVRQPIYKTSVGRWKTYQQYLGPMQRVLSL